MLAREPNPPNTRSRRHRRGSQNSLLGTQNLSNYGISIVPGLLFIQVIGACEQALAAMKAEGRHPAPLADLSPDDAFARVGAAEWDPRRKQYRAARPRAAE